MKWIMLCLVLSGCAVGDYWVRTHRSIPQPWNYHTVADPDLVCRSLGMYRSGVILACAKWNKDVCDIYLPPNPTPELVAHEEKHCMGWNHR